MSKFVHKKIHYCKVECICVCVCVFFSQFCDVAQVVITCKMISQIWLKTEYDLVKNFKAVLLYYWLPAIYHIFERDVASGHAYF